MDECNEEEGWLNICPARRSDWLPIADVVADVGLVLEEFPITSVYINKLAGRTADDSKHHYTRQSSSVLVAHKTVDFTYHPPGPQFDPPRTSQLEAIGIVVSQKHPPSVTFLAPAMAEHLLHRCAKYLSVSTVRRSTEEHLFSPTSPVVIPFFSLSIILKLCYSLFLFAFRPSFLPFPFLRHEVHDGGRQGIDYCFRA